MSVPKVTISTDRHVRGWESGVLEELMATPLSALGEELLTRLVAQGSRKRLQPGQQFQRRDERVEHVAVVVSGFLRIYRLNPEGKIHVLRSIGAGQVFNLLPILDHGPAISDADAVEVTELLLIPKAPFLALMNSEAALRDAVHRIIYARSRMTYDELADMVLLTLRQRCARVLVSMAHMQHAIGALPEGVSLVVTQTELSDILGYSRPKVNAELKALQRDGLIALSYNRIHIPDLAVLAALAKS